MCLVSISFKRERGLKQFHVMLPQPQADWRITMNHHHGGLGIPTVGRSGTAVTTNVCRYLAMTSDSHSVLCVQVMLVGAVGRMQFW